MTDERYNQLTRNYSLKLTQEELEEGWHFCREYDELLIGPGMEEQACCLCPFLKKDAD